MGNEEEIKATPPAPEADAKIETKDPQDKPVEGSGSNIPEEQKDDNNNMEDTVTESKKDVASSSDENKTVDVVEKAETKVKIEKEEKVEAEKEEKVETEKEEKVEIEKDETVETGEENENENENEKEESKLEVGEGNNNKAEAAAVVEKGDASVVEDEDDDKAADEMEEKSETDEVKVDNDDEGKEKEDEVDLEEEKVEEVNDDSMEVVTPNPTPAKRGRKKKGEGGPKAVMTMGLHQTDLTPLSSGKRTRKSATRLSPELIDTPNKKDFVIPLGRGLKLEDIDDVKAKIRATKKDSPVLKDAHSLLFTIRGRPKQNQVKSHLLQFSGYLVPIASDGTKQELEVNDEESETKMSVKAFKLTVNQLRNLATLFNIKTDATDKEGLVDNLLDFLGAPDPLLTKGSKKKGGKSPTKIPKSPATTVSKKRKKKNGEENTPSKKRSSSGSKQKRQEKEEVEESDEYESNSDDEMEIDETPSSNTKTPKMPSDSKLREWVKAYVGCFNLDKATTKHALETASDKFGVDMNNKKTKIKMLLADELS